LCMDSNPERGRGNWVFPRGGRIGKTAGFPEVKIPGRRTRFKNSIGMLFLYTCARHRPTGRAGVAQKSSKILCVTTKCRLLKMNFIFVFIKHIFK
jgi:hypothetical protein